MPGRVTVTIDGVEMRGRGRRARHQGGPGPRRLHPPVLLARAHEAGRHVPHVPGRDRGAAGPAPGLHRHRHRRDGGQYPDPGREEGPGGRPRVPPHQPPARLPGLRPGRRVPPPGPDLRLRPGGEPVRGGEAALRQAAPHLRSRAARPGALHPLRPLHPLRRRGGRRPAHPVRRAGGRDAGAHLPQPAVHLLLLGEHRPDLSRSARCWPPPTGSGPGRGTCRRWRRRASCARWAAALRCSPPPTGSSGRSVSTPSPSTTAGCATRAGSPSTTSTTPTASSNPRCAARIPLMAATGRGAPGPRPSTPPPPGWPARWSGAARRRWPSSAAPGAPTRTPTPGPASPRACSRPTTSTARWATACRPRS